MRAIDAVRCAGESCFARLLREIGFSGLTSVTHVGANGDRVFRVVIPPYGMNLTLTIDLSMEPQAIVTLGLQAETSSTTADAVDVTIECDADATESWEIDATLSASSPLDSLRRHFGLRTPRDQRPLTAQQGLEAVRTLALFFRDQVPVAPVP